MATHGPDAQQYMDALEVLRANGIAEYQVTQTDEGLTIHVEFTERLVAIDFDADDAYIEWRNGQ